MKTASGVAEFAMWAAPALGARYLDLQYTDRFRSQPLPPWTRRVPPVDGGAGGGRALAVGSGAHRSLVADAFCAALAAGCARECAEFHRRAWPPRPGELADIHSLHPRARALAGLLVRCSRVTEAAIVALLVVIELSAAPPVITL